MDFVKRSPSIARLAGFTLLVATLSALASPTRAQEFDHVFVVNWGGDGGDLDAGDGVCDALINRPVGCTLRAALEEARELRLETALIEVAVPLVTLVNDEPLCIPSYVTVRGTAATRPRIESASGLGLIMLVEDEGCARVGGSHKPVVERLEILGANTNGAGAIRVVGEDLTLRDVVVQAAQGTGIDVDSGSLLVERSHVSGHTGTGGIRIIDGSLRMTDTMVYENRGTGDPAGGGITLVRSTGYIARSLIYDNLAESGGGIFVGEASELTVVASSIGGNGTTGSGGGIWVDPASTVRLQSSTLAGNQAGTGGEKVLATGGGIFVSSGATATARNSIIARNRIPAADAFSGIEAPGDTYDDCAGTLTAEGPNLLETTAGCSVTGDTTGLITAQDPKLYGPGDHGGATFVYAISASSPAVDAGAPGGCTGDHDLDSATPDQLLGSDQRRMTRSLDGNGDGVVRCDLGAFELDLPLFSDGFEAGDTSAWGAS